MNICHDNLKLAYKILESGKDSTTVCSLCVYDVKEENCPRTHDSESLLCVTEKVNLTHHSGYKVHYFKYDLKKVLKKL